jgi:hypothetical protein
MNKIMCSENITKGTCREKNIQFISAFYKFKFISSVLGLFIFKDQTLPLAIIDFQN